MLNKTKKQWIVWRREIVKGKITKVPYRVNGHKASVTNKNSWSTYDEVKKVAHEFDGIGIVATGNMLFIDLDHILNVGVIADAPSRKLVNEANSYTEISPSGDGLHIMLNLSEPFVPVRNAYKPNEKVKYEAYSEKRYFTVTENLFEAHGDVRTIDGIEAERLLAILGYPWEKVAPRIGLPRQAGLAEADVEKVMFRAANKQKAKRLWDGDTSMHKGDTSQADMALVCLLAFYCGNNPDMIERLWLKSPSGQRDKTRDRKDYRDRTIKAALILTTEFYAPPNATGYIEKGEKILLCTENIQRFLDTSKQLMGRLRFDEFKQKIEYRKVDTWNDLCDADLLEIQRIVSSSHPAFAMLALQMTDHAVQSNAYIHSFDSAKEFLTALKWDSTPRLDTWIHKTYGTPDDAYHTAVGANWVKGMVNRMMNPGCKFDYVLVLEGAQGSKKSMSIGVVAHPWHAETTLTPDSKDFFMVFLGNAVVEFAEGETISRSEVKKLKAVITMQEDVLRLPYARMTSRIPRRCVFAMTTNEERYFKDDTGNRRWLPVTIGSEPIDIEWLKANRDQLLAEAFHRVITLKETTWEFPKEETEEAQRLRRFVDPQAELIVDWYLGLTLVERDAGITTRTTFEAVNKSVTGWVPKMERIDEMRIATVLKESLRLVSKRTMQFGVQKNRYFPTEKTPEAVSLESQFNSEISIF